MFAAHMDSIGLMVTHIDEKGFLRFGQVGAAPNKVLHTPVRFENGARGVVSLDCGSGAQGHDSGGPLSRRRRQTRRRQRPGPDRRYRRFRRSGALPPGTGWSSPYMDDRIACGAPQGP